METMRGSCNKTYRDVATKNEAAGAINSAQSTTAYLCKNLIIYYDLVQEVHNTNM